MFTVSKTHKMCVVYIKSPIKLGQGLEKIEPHVFPKVEPLNNQFQQKINFSTKIAQ